MNYLEFVQRMLTMANIPLVKLGVLHILLEDAEAVENGIKCNAKITVVNSEVNDEVMTATAFGSDLRMHDLSIVLEDIDGTIETAVIVATTRALAIKLQEQASDIASIKADGKVISLLQVLNNEKMSVDAGLANIAYDELLIKLSQCALNFTNKLCDSKNISAPISLEDIDVTISTDTALAVNELTGLNIELDDEQMSSYAVLYQFLFIELIMVLADEMLIANSIKADALLKELSLEQESEIATIAAIAFRYARIIDYYSIKLEDMEPKTLDQLNKIFIGG